MQNKRLAILSVTLLVLLYMTREQVGKPAATFIASKIGPRGIRNNNPGNIRVSADKWQGAIGDDGAFFIFDTPENGIRALARILKNYRTKYNLKNIAGIIARWAPASENNTASYIQAVARSTGHNAGDTLALNLADYGPLVSAIILHENGLNPYPQSTIDAGVSAGIA